MGMPAEITDLVTTADVVNYLISEGARYELESRYETAFLMYKRAFNKDPEHGQEALGCCLGALKNLRRVHLDNGDEEGVKNADILMKMVKDAHELYFGKKPEELPKPVQRGLFPLDVGSDLYI